MPAAPEVRRGAAARSTPGRKPGRIPGSRQRRQRSRVVFHHRNDCWWEQRVPARLTLAPAGPPRRTGGPPDHPADTAGGEVQHEHVEPAGEGDRASVRGPRRPASPDEVSEPAPVRVHRVHGAASVERQSSSVRRPRWVQVRGGPGPFRANEWMQSGAVGPNQPQAERPAVALHREHDLAAVGGPGGHEGVAGEAPLVLVTTRELSNTQVDRAGHELHKGPAWMTRRRDDVDVGSPTSQRSPPRRFGPEMTKARPQNVVFRRDRGPRGLSGRRGTSPRSPRSCLRADRCRWLRGATRGRWWRRRGSRGRCGRSCRRCCR